MAFYHIKDGIVYNDYDKAIGKAIEFKLTTKLMNEFRATTTRIRDLWNPSQTWKKQKRARDKETWIACAPYGVTFIAAGAIHLSYVVGYYASNGEIVWYC